MALDVRYAPGERRGQEWKGDLEGLCKGLGELGSSGCGSTTSTPYPHVDRVMPLMAQGKILPYLRHSFPARQPQRAEGHRKTSRHPGEKTFERIANWRAQVPNLAIRSTFVVGFPGETEADFDVPAAVAGRGPARSRRRLRL